MVKFMTNTVKVGPSKSFADLVNEKMNKTAAAKDPIVKTAAAEEEETETEKINNNVQNDPKVKEENTETTKATKKDTKGDEAASSGQLDVEPLHQKGESQKPSAVTVENKKTEAAKAPTFVKVAKLDSKTKSMLKAYWDNLYPAEYVDAMLTDQ